LLWKIGRKSREAIFSKNDEMQHHSWLIKMIGRHALKNYHVFSIGFGITLVKSLYCGGFHYYSMGYEKGIASGSSPIKFTYLSVGI